jgi:methylmalonyl-CoA/ethylmalonyl-CoA epimerase
MAHKILNLIKVNVRTKEMAEARYFFQDILGADLKGDRGDDTIGEFTGSMVQFGDDVVDIVAPTHDKAPLAKAIEKRGQGLDSLCYEVENLEDTIAHLKENGIEVFNRNEYHGSKIAFIHPKDGLGIMIELIERSK